MTMTAEAAGGRTRANALSTFDELSRLLGMMGYSAGAFDAGAGALGFSKEVAPHIVIRAKLQRDADASDVVGVAGKYCVIDDSVLASEPMRDATRETFLPLLDRLEAEAESCWVCHDCERLIHGGAPLYRPRHSARQVCGPCSRGYRNCITCGSESLERVCPGCRSACLVESNFPALLSPAQRILFAVNHFFSVCHTPGSVTQIAKRARCNVPTAKRFVERAAGTLERVTGVDGVRRYRLRLQSRRLS